MEHDNDDPTITKWYNRPPTIDLEEIRAWLQTCRGTHGDRCNNRYSDRLSKLLNTLTLIDVHTASLVVLPSSTPYVALSYCWGVVPMFKAFKSNMNDLMKEGALNATEPNIPDTIRDAMHVVKSLGERYLWCDCVSIVQDQDEESMNTMLRAMAEIYACAEFTIAAADGSDANHGLRGTGGISQRREPMGNHFSDDEVGYPWGSKWASRGWTFQESLFSRRLLVFAEVVTWICGECVGCEIQGLFDAVTDPAKDYPGIPTNIMSRMPMLADLEFWSILVDKFSERELTFEGDVDRAVASMTNVLGSTFPGGILHGLPIFCFDIALLWQPSPQVLRRSGSPSWSWTGWKGPVVTQLSWPAFYAGPKAPFYAGPSPEEFSVDPGIEENSSVVSLRSSNEATLRPVASLQLHAPVDSETSYIASHLNGFYEYQAFAEKRDAKLPSGWSRHVHTHYDLFTCTMDGKEKEGSRYSMPLPTADSSPPSVYVSPYLRCTAPHTTVNIGTINKHKYGSHYHPGSYATITQGDKIIGAILLHDEEAGVLSSGSSCELIALSEAHVRPDCIPHEDCYPAIVDEVRAAWEAEAEAEAQGGGVGSDSSIYDFYNVLWIGWDGDIATRRGLGIIGKKAWESLEAEIVSIILG